MKSPENKNKIKATIIGGLLLSSNKKRLFNVSMGWYNTNRITEFLILKNGTQIRLDKIIKINEIPPANFK